MKYSTDKEDYVGVGEKKIEEHSHDQGKLVVISAKPSVAYSVIHDHDHDCTPTFKQTHNMQRVSHIHTFT
jgi:hypothetical protein